MIDCPIACLPHKKLLSLTHTHARTHIHFLFIWKLPDLFLLQAGVMEEMVNDAVDSALDSEDIEDEIEEEVDKVLTAIAGETTAQLPEAVRKQKLKQPAQAVEEAEVCPLIL